MILKLPSKDEIFKVDASSFEDIALQVFNYQAEYNIIYKKFLQVLDKDPKKVNSIYEIPFLPIDFFKSHKVISENASIESIFESSGTTGLLTSKHYISEIQIYKEAIAKQFEINFGNIKEYCILALLPSYLERKNASLVFMCNEWMQLSSNNKNGFYLNQFNTLKDVITILEHNKQKTILIGVSFALLDFAEYFPTHLKHTLIIETGGMKGRRKEITRNALHEFLKVKWQVPEIISEYGMTELLSQCYAFSNGKFSSPAWMKILVRDIEDPFTFVEKNKSGLLNIIDLLNIHSCSFIATMDIGKVDKDDYFEVLGRYDKSDVRGCNLLVE